MSKALQALPNLSIIIPTYNEEEQLGLLLDEIERDLAKRFDLQIIVVDDGSQDGTNIIAREHGAQVITFSKNLGYGHALRAGLEYAKAPIVVILDSDGEYDPKEIPRLVTMITSNKADLVYASKYRLLQSPRKSSIIGRVGNLLLSLIIKFLWNFEVSDIQTGLMAINNEDLKRFDLKENTFFAKYEILKQAKEKKLTIGEIPVVTRYRQTRTNVTLLNFQEWFRVILLERFH